MGLIHWAFPPTSGGVESHLADLGRLLSKAGCHVTVVTGELQPVRSPYYEVECVESLNLDLLRDQRENGVERVARLREELRRIVTAKRLTVIHGHNLHHFWPWPALALEDLRKELGLRVYHTFHETWPDVLHDKPVYRKWDGNYAVSSFVRNQCHDCLGFRPRLLRLGVDTCMFRPLTRPFSRGGKAVILHPARLLPWKGVHLSLRALADLRIKGCDAKLVLTDTPRIADWKQELLTYRREIVALVSSLGLSDCVEFRAPSYSEMAALYDTADIVIYPTIGEEPYGLVPLEAMSCGRPVVASRSGGISETVVDGETGFLVRRGDVDALSNRLSTLLAHPRMACRFGAAGRQRVESRFDIRTYVAALVGDYNRRLRWPMS